MKPFYRIGEVAALLGEKTYVVRFWEQQFGLRPSRNNGGQRVYTRAQLVYLLAAKQLLRDMGYTIWGAKQQLDRRPIPADAAT